MGYEVIMPALGMAQDTGLLVGWLKAVGDAVASDDPLMEVETDKTTMEVPAGADGFIAELRASVGEDVPVGQVIAVITAEASDLSAAASPEKAPEPMAEAPTKAKEPSTDPKPAPASVKPSLDLPDAAGCILASPKAKRLSAEAGLDLSRLAETGASQPYRAADIEALKNLPTQARTPDMAYAPVASHIGAEVAADGFDAFVERMRSEGGVDVTLTQTAVAFAAAGLRRATGAENLTVSAMVDGTRMTYADPDYLRLSAVKGVEGDGPSDLDIRVLDSGHLTSVVLGGAIQPVLAVSRNAQTFHLTLTFTEGTLSADQAIEAMHALTRRLADPMLALI